MKTLVERLARLKERRAINEALRAKNQAFVDAGATICQFWADHFEDRVQRLDQLIYETNLQIEMEPDENFKGFSKDGMAIYNVKGGL